MEEESYGVTLELITNKFKQQISNLKGTLTKFKQDTKKSTEIIFDSSLGIKELNKMKSVLQEMIDKEKEMMSVPGFGVADAKSQQNIDNYTRKLKLVDDRIKEIKNDELDASEKSRHFGESISNNMKRGEKNIKKFAFSLLSVRGIFGLLRKASSSYMAQDQELSDQMQRTWASLGALLAPIIEKLVQAIRTAAAYINYFVKALTGRDLIAKATKKVNSYNKGLVGTAKEAKSANKELTSLDEITNLSFDSESGGFGGGGISDEAENIKDAFDDFGDIKLDKNITAALKNIANVTKAVFKGIGETIDWWYDHSIGKIKKANNELNKSIKDNKEQQKSVTSYMKDYTKAGSKYVTQTDKITSTTVKYNKSLIDSTNRTRALIDATRGQYNGWTKLTGAYKDVDKQIKEIVQREKNNTDALRNTYEQGKLTTEQARQYKNMLKEQITYYQELANKTKIGTTENKLYNDRIKELSKDLNSINGKKYVPKVEVETNESKTTSFIDKIKNFAKQKFGINLGVNVKTSDAKSKLNSFFSGINNFASKISSAFGGLFKGTTSSISSLINKFIPSFDVGTNYIPRDTLAQVHKGEMIVPAKYNPATSGIGTGNSETNALLIELNRNVLELAGKPTILNVNGKELAQATYKDYQNEGNRLNTSASISIK